MKYGLFYQNIYSKLRCIPNVKHKILLNHNKVIQCNSYPISHKNRDKTIQELKTLLEAGVIRHSDLEFASSAYPI